MSRAHSSSVMAAESTKPCSRCGGTGRVSRGWVVNGVCFKCGGDGKHRPRYYAPRGSGRIIHFAIVNAEGHHLALNTDRAVLEAMLPTLAGATGIVQVS